MKLQDKVAIVTGGGRGIGRAVAVALAQEGAKVVVNYSRSADAAEQTVAEIETAGGVAMAIQADVACAEAVNGLVKRAVETFGRVDILINNAGILRDKLLLRMTEEDWDAVLDTNLKGAFLCAKAVASGMVKQKGGVIINVGSVIGKVGGAGQVNYSASKAGLIGLTKSLAKELGSRNVRVNAVAPGFIETEMTEVLKPEYREAVLKQIPLGRFGAAEDVARVVVFLCSGDAAYIQGEVISIDGGLFM
ncbi:MAG TPA: 3-oxoacyl-[acyl-carrier-protein] reductase [Chthonomonadaceae bacterium]|nr:3-oxoacyl-[acyl-carrier-protein] reductase [Chthonomonadaceae bacterium]